MSGFWLFFLRLWTLCFFWGSYIFSFPGFCFDKAQFFGELKNVGDELHELLWWSPGNSCCRNGRIIEWKPWTFSPVTSRAMEHLGWDSQWRSSQGWTSSVCIGKDFGTYHSSPCSRKNPCQCVSCRGVSKIFAVTPLVKAFPTDLRSGLGLACVKRFTRWFKLERRFAPTKITPRFFLKLMARLTCAQLGGFSGRCLQSQLGTKGGEMDGVTKKMVLS